MLLIGCFTYKMVMPKCMKTDILKKTCDDIAVVCADIRCIEKSRNIADKLQVNVIKLYPEDADDVCGEIRNDDRLMCDRSAENIENNISCEDPGQKSFIKEKKKESCRRTVSGNVPINNLENRPYIKVSPAGVSLCKEGMEMHADLAHMIKRIKKNNLQGELLVKAAKFSDKCRTVFDATAGMAEDSLLLAGAGFHVTLYEKNPVIYILVKDALERAEKIPELAEAVSRMRLVNGDSIEAMLKLGGCAGCQAEERAKKVSGPTKALSGMMLVNGDSVGTMVKMSEDAGCCSDNGVMADSCNSEMDWSIEGDAARPPDIILLDPMFPERQKSGLVKKKFQLIHNLECPCNDENELLEAAMAARPQKIIIKRPLKGPYLAGIKPSYSLAGKSIRYDCIINIK